MLSKQLTNTILFSTPFLNRVICAKKSKLNAFYSFSYNEQGLYADVLFDCILMMREKIDMLSCLKNVVDTALSHLTNKEREVIKLFYFFRYSVDQICITLNLCRSSVLGRLYSALKKLRFSIEILGFSEEIILKYFDADEPFISSARYSKIVSDRGKNVRKSRNHRQSKA